ncbi:hypothetical protein J5J10_15400 [Ciceribacter sp. L1K23]|uniref:hypothetical protein n=1 Tax=Ciceribacter sp. L1K23 TaxID=2820276 RepID=UPI001B83947E|nr:hypothetical protein [Ciceribacter sp. L1K23]MBR0557073.1 hypothetical protein [Ciceribacter sp. L1K23]
MTTTKSKVLAEEYMRLGGKRLAKIDDNITKVRKWEDDPPAAEQFWQEHIAVLDDKGRRDVEFYLPDINAD